jgi:hypothetical protein
LCRDCTYWRAVSKYTRGLYLVHTASALSPGLSPRPPSQHPAPQPRRTAARRLPSNGRSRRCPLSAACVPVDGAEIRPALGRGRARGGAPKGKTPRQQESDGGGYSSSPVPGRNARKGHRLACTWRSMVFTIRGDGIPALPLLVPGPCGYPPAEYSSTRYGRSDCAGRLQRDSPAEPLSTTTTTDGGVGRRYRHISGNR